MSDLLSVTESVSLTSPDPLSTRPIRVAQSVRPIDIISVTFVQTVQNCELHRLSSCKTPSKSLPLLSLATAHAGTLKLAWPALHLKPFRFSNVSAASGRQRCFASCVSVDFLRLQSSTFKCWYLWVLDRWCRLVGVTPACRTGTILFAGREWVDLALILR